jgi:hypothetical protein
VLLDAAQQARRELARPAPVVQVAGQHTELWYDVPRGHGLVHATGNNAAYWLAAALLAGNGITLFDGDSLAATIEALKSGGVPESVLGSDPGGVKGLLSAAESPLVAFAAIDGGPALARALYERLGPTTEEQHVLKALLSPFDGPQPGERGFMQRFAWPRVTAVRTLRHGAEHPAAMPLTPRLKRHGLKGRGGHGTLVEGRQP